MCVVTVGYNRTADLSNSLLLYRLAWDVNGYSWTTGVLQVTLRKCHCGPLGPLVV